MFAPLPVPGVDCYAVRGPEPFRPSARKSGHHVNSKSRAKFFQAGKLRRDGMADSENDHLYSNPDRRFRSGPALIPQEKSGMEIAFYLAEPENERTENGSM